MSGFVQIVEFKTSRLEEIRALGEQLRATQEARGDSAVRRATITSDRDRPGYYLNIVEFESYESAMANSSRRETSEFAAAMAELCEEPPRFYNLEVVQAWAER